MYIIKDELKDLTYQLQIKFNEQTIMTHQEVSLYMLSKYGNYKTTAHLVDLWALYHANSGENLLKVLTALETEYNPIENYSRNEKNIVLTNNGKTTDTRTPDETRNYVENSQGENGTTLESYATTDDNATERLTNKNIQKGTVKSIDNLKVKNENERTETTFTDGDTTYTAHDIQATTNKTTGNIGVTTTQRMLQSEIDLRKQNILFDYIDRFIYQFTYYVY